MPYLDSKGDLVYWVQRVQGGSTGREDNQNASTNGVAQEMSARVDENSVYRDGVYTDGRS